MYSTNMYIDTDSHKLKQVKIVIIICQTSNQVVMMRRRWTVMIFKIHLWCKSIVKTLHYFQGMESYEQCGQGQSYCSLYTLDNIHRFFFFVTRLIIYIINKVQWVDFKLENVLVSLHSSIDLHHRWILNIITVHLLLIITTNIVIRLL
jgi:hypothetical protein